MGYLNCWSLQLRNAPTVIRIMMVDGIPHGITWLSRRHDHSILFVLSSPRPWAKHPIDGGVNIGGVRLY